MMPYPNETWSDYCARYRTECEPLRDLFFMGTTARHKLGDISRDKPDYFIKHSEDDDNYIGNWVTGFGFINVKFPKEASRPVTDEEWQWFLDNPVTMA